MTPAAVLDLVRRVVRSAATRRAGALALVGALAFGVLGTTPGALEGATTDAAGWQVAAPAAPDLAPAQAVFTSMPLWSTQPAPAAPVDATPPPPPPPRLLGVFRVGPRGAAAPLEGLFLLPDGRRVRAVAGAELPDGTRVERLAPTSAALRMSDGRDIDLRLLDAAVPR